MEKRRYSIQDIQRMTQLSPNTLQDLLQRYRQHFAIEVVHGNEGEQLFMDQASLERLMFIKQLELRQTLTTEETISQIGDSAPRTLPAMKNLGPDAPTPSGSKLNSLLSLLDRLGNEIHGVEGSLRTLLLRYSQVLRELNVSREENRQLRREVDQLKQRQQMLIRQTDIDQAIEAEKKPSIN